MSEQEFDLEKLTDEQVNQLYEHLVQVVLESSPSNA